jgi:hypothetical protein
MDRPALSVGRQQTSLNQISIANEGADQPGNGIGSGRTISPFVRFESQFHRQH